MNYLQILGTCPEDIGTIMKIVRFVVTAICWAIPIILIVLCVLDIAKIVTAGNIDDKLKKEVTGRITTRIIFAILIFLVPTIVKFILRVVPLNTDTTIDNATWEDCWNYGQGTTQP